MGASRRAETATVQITGLCVALASNIQSSVYNTFYAQHHLLSRFTFKRFRTDAFNVWESASAAT